VERWRATVRQAGKVRPSPRQVRKVVGGGGAPEPYLRGKVRATPSQSGNKGTKAGKVGRRGLCLARAGRRGAGRLHRAEKQNPGLDSGGLIPV
jgi:hypothetical protein